MGVFAILEDEARTPLSGSHRAKWSGPLSDQHRLRQPRLRRPAGSSAYADPDAHPPGHQRWVLRGRRQRDGHRVARLAFLRRTIRSGEEEARASSAVTVTPAPS